MSCRKFEDRVVAYAYGELAAGDVAVVEGHLADCEACSKEVELFQVASSGMHAMPEPPAPSLHNERLRQAILSDELKAKSPWALRFGLGGATLAGLAAAWVFIINRPADAPLTQEPVKYAANVEPTPKVIAPIPETSWETIAPSASELRSSQGYPDIVVAKRHTKRHGITKVGGNNVSVVSAPTTRKPSGDVTTLLAIADGGASNTANVYAENPTTAGNFDAAPVIRDVIVIRPGSSGATEVKAPDGLAIGG